MTVITRLHTALATLGLTEADAVLDAHLERAATEERAYADLLGDLLDREVEARRARSASCGPCGLPTTPAT